jgi:hypothetical protein
LIPRRPRRSPSENRWQPASPEHYSESGDRDGTEIALSELWVRDGARQRTAVRWELFLFRAVRDVLATRDPDQVLVVHHGPPVSSAWAAVLLDAGFDAAGPARVKIRRDPPWWRAAALRERRRHATAPVLVRPGSLGRVDWTVLGSRFAYERKCDAAGESFGSRARASVSVRRRTRVARLLMSGGGLDGSASSAESGNPVTVEANTYRWDGGRTSIAARRLPVRRIGSLGPALLFVEDE